MRLDFEWMRTLDEVRAFMDGNTPSSGRRTQFAAAAAKPAGDALPRCVEHRIVVRGNGGHWPLDVSKLLAGVVGEEPTRRSRPVWRGA